MNGRKPRCFDARGGLRQTVKAGADRRRRDCVIGHILAPMGLRNGKVYPVLIRAWIDKRPARPKLVLFMVCAYSGPRFWNAREEM